MKISFLDKESLNPVSEKLASREALGVTYDMHIHTCRSHDSDARIEDIVKSARDRGLSGIAITDHLDVEYFEDQGQGKENIASFKDALRMKSTSSIDVLAGIEIGEAIWDINIARNAISAAEYDVILGSVHAVKYKGIAIPYSKIDFSAFSDDDISGYFSAYLTDVKRTAQELDFDVLSHLTCPLRYINGKYGKALCADEFLPQIYEILEIIIRKGIALEVNTSADSLIPDKSIIKVYADMGGELVTLGSDAHIAQRVGQGFDAAKSVLTSLGIKNICFYKKRKPYTCKIL